MLHLQGGFRQYPARRTRRPGGSRLSVRIHQQGEAGVGNRLNRDDLPGEHKVPHQRPLRLGRNRGKGAPALAALPLARGIRGVREAGLHGARTRVEQAAGDVQHGDLLACLWPITQLAGLWPIARSERCHGKLRAMGSMTWAACGRCRYTEPPPV